LAKVVVCRNVLVWEGETELEWPEDEELSDEEVVVETEVAVEVGVEEVTAAVPELGEVLGVEGGLALLEDVVAEVFVASVLVPADDVDVGALDVSEVTAVAEVVDGVELGRGAVEVDVRVVLLGGGTAVVELFVASIA